MIKLEFRVETYNLFNTLNLSNSSIDNTLGSVNPGGSVQFRARNLPGESA
jgi:hypothetical protein